LTFKYRSEVAGVTTARSPECAELELLGGFCLRCRGEPARVPRSAQRLLALLALRDRSLPRAHVAGLLWDDAPGDKANGSLRSALWRLRRLPGRRLVDVFEDDLRIADHVDVDLRRAWGLAERLVQGSDEGADALDVDALAHDLLPAWDEPWVGVERECFRQARLHALEMLSARLAGHERFGEAVGAALAAVAADPLRESAHRALIGVYIAEGNRGEALRQYRTCHRIFSDRLGLRPSDRLETLIERALARS
jgi:DNA-binding SARP family transcriptional activator